MSEQGEGRAFDYLAACRAAAEGQGVGAIEEALEARGVKVDVEQTGGFMMVAVVEHEGLAYTLTDDGDILLGVQTVEVWSEGGEGEYTTFPTVEEAADAVAMAVKPATVPELSLESIALVLGVEVEHGGWLDIPLLHSTRLVSNDRRDKPTSSIRLAFDGDAVSITRYESGKESAVDHREVPTATGTVADVVTAVRSLIPKD